MKLLLGLGNIGTHFDGTRHNAGFEILDTFAIRHALAWQTKDAFKAVVAKGVVSDQPIILAKPTTYYNVSGESLRRLKDFYKIENHDIVIVHDELALPFGTIRARVGGSDAGNNGIKNIIAHIGADTARIRIGIASSLSPQADAVDFVLSRFTARERRVWPEVQKNAERLLDDFVHSVDKAFEHTSLQVITDVPE